MPIEKPSKMVPWTAIVSSGVVVFGALAARQYWPHSIAHDQAAITGQSAETSPGNVQGVYATASARPEIVKNAAAEVGLGEYDPKNVKAYQEILTAESMPCLGYTLNGKRAWVVEFDDVHLTIDGKGGVNKYIRNLRVVMAPDSERILSVTSSWPKGVPSMKPVPPAKEFARQLAASGTKYVGLPGEAPQITLIDSLKTAMFWGGDVKQIIAYYVNATTVAYSGRPLWVVQVRGFEPFDPMGGEAGGVPTGARDHMCSMIDAKTGKGLSAESIPQPVE